MELEENKFYSCKGMDMVYIGEYDADTEREKERDDLEFLAYVKEDNAEFMTKIRIPRKNISLEGSTITFEGKSEMSASYSWKTSDFFNFQKYKEIYEHALEKELGLVGGSID